MDDGFVRARVHPGFSVAQSSSAVESASAMSFPLGVIPLLGMMNLPSASGSAWLFSLLTPGGHMPLAVIGFWSNMGFCVCAAVVIWGIFIWLKFVFTQRINRMNIMARRLLPLEYRDIKLSFDPELIRIGVQKAARKGHSWQEIAEALADRQGQYLKPSQITLFYSAVILYIVGIVSLCVLPLCVASTTLLLYTLIIFLLSMGEALVVHYAPYERYLLYRFILRDRWNDQIQRLQIFVQRYFNGNEKKTLHEGLWLGEEDQRMDSNFKIEQKSWLKFLGSIKGRVITLLVMVPLLLGLANVLTLKMWILIVPFIDVVILLIRIMVKLKEGRVSSELYNCQQSSSSNDKVLLRAAGVIPSCSKDRFPPTQAPATASEGPVPASGSKPPAMQPQWLKEYGQYKAAGQEEYFLTVIIPQREERMRGIFTRGPPEDFADTHQEGILDLSTGELNPLTPQAWHVLFRIGYRADSARSQVLKKWYLWALALIFPPMPLLIFYLAYRAASTRI